MMKILLEGAYFRDSDLNPVKDLRPTSLFCESYKNKTVSHKAKSNYKSVTKIRAFFDTNYFRMKKNDINRPTAFSCQIKTSVFPHSN